MAGVGPWRGPLRNYYPHPAHRRDQHQAIYPISQQLYTIKHQFRRSSRVRDQSRTYSNGLQNLAFDKALQRGKKTTFYALYQEQFVIQISFIFRLKRDEGL